MCGIMAWRAATTMIYPITTRKHKQWIQFFAMPRCWTFLPCQVSQCHKNFYISKCFNRSSHFNVLFSSWFKNWSIKIFYVNQLDNYSIVQFLDWLRIIKECFCVQYQIYKFSFKIFLVSSLVSDENFKTKIHKYGVAIIFYFVWSLRY